MPKPLRVPSYRLHKTTGQAVVTISGRDYYLGDHNTPRSLQRYHEMVANLIAGRLPNRTKSPTVADVLTRYRTHADEYYRKNGKPTSEVWLIRCATQHAIDLYGSRQVDAFDVLALRAVRESLIDAGYCRSQVNKLVGRVVRAFRWATTEKLYPGSLLDELRSLPGLRRGRTRAPETPPVEPVDDAIYEATLPHLPKVVADMARLQRCTGMRPGEVVIVRPMDVDRSGEVWIFTPDSHKTEHHGKSRVVLIGPKGQEILTPYLLRPEDEFCFRSNRAAPIPRKQRRYRRDTYTKAISRGARKAYPLPEGSSEREEEQWAKRYWWSPNQLRHTYATEVRREHGLEAAQVLLGHSSASITQVYAERDHARGVEVARLIG